MSKFNKGVIRTWLPTIIVIVLLIGGGILTWHYRGILKTPEEKIVEEEIHYPEKVNNIESQKLIKIARDYILTEPKLYFNNSQWVNWNDEETLGAKLDANWIVDHEPESIEYNPPDKWPSSYVHFNDKYVVRWFFIPGCEERPGNKISKPNWFNEQGIQCVGGYILNALIKPDFELDQILLDMVRGTVQ